MDQLRAMRVFVTVVEQGTISGAARQIGLSPPSATRILDTLEAHLGVVLIRRTTRALSLTEEGSGYLAACRQILAAVEDADRTATGARTQPRGRLAVTAPVEFGKRHVAPLVLEFIQNYPETNVSLALLDRTVSLVDEGFDIGVRIGPLKAMHTVTVRVGAVRSVVCASPRYLDARGTPASPHDLAGHDLIEQSTMGAFGSVWSFSEDGRDLALRLAPRFAVNDADVAVSAAVNGAGITRVLSYQASRHVAAGRLRIILPTFERASVPVSLIFAAGRPRSAAMRAFVDMVRPRLAAALGMSDGALEGDPAQPSAS